MSKNKLNNKNAKKVDGVKRNQIFNRITLIVVLGLFLLLTISSIITFGMSALVAKWMRVDEDNILVFAVIVMGMSVIFGLALSFAYSAIMMSASRPYRVALQRAAECYFTV